MQSWNRCRNSPVKLSQAGACWQPQDSRAWSPVQFLKYRSCQRGTRAAIGRSTAGYGKGTIRSDLMGKANGFSVPLIPSRGKVKSARPVRERARGTAIGEDAQGPGEIIFLLNPHAQRRTDRILADRAGNAGPDEAFHVPFNFPGFRRCKQQFHTSTHGVTIEHATYGCNSVTPRKQPRGFSGKEQGNKPD